MSSLNANKCFYGFFLLRDNICSIVTVIYVLWLLNKGTIVSA